MTTAHEKIPTCMLSCLHSKYVAENCTQLSAIWDWSLTKLFYWTCFKFMKNCVYHNLNTMKLQHWVLVLLGRLVKVLCLTSPHTYHPHLLRPCNYCRNVESLSLHSVIITKFLMYIVHFFVSKGAKSKQNGAVYRFHSHGTKFPDFSMTSKSCVFSMIFQAWKNTFQFFRTLMSPVTFLPGI